MADRNSVLGKVALPSQRLVYEIRFLQQGTRCAAEIRADYPDLATRLDEVLAAKRETLPGVIWQATLGGAEFRALWSPGNQSAPAAFGPNSALVATLAQLQSDIDRWLAGDYTIDPDRLEEQLQVIRTGDAGVQLKAWSMLAGELDAASETLRAREAKRPLCFPGMHTADADIFGNVVRKQFIGGIQAWSAGLSRGYYALFPGIHDLEQLLSKGEPVKYNAWREARDMWLHDARGATVRHVEALKPLLDQCGLLPATNVTENL